MLNKAILIGNLGQDPDIRQTSDGRELANFSLATTEYWKDKNTGEKKDKTEWHKVVVFSQGLVGIVKNYVKKGTKLYIEGQLQTRKWTDNNGIDKYSTEIVLQNFNSSLQILSNRDGGDSGGYQQKNQNQNQGQAVNSTAAVSNPADDIIDDEIPF
jgi:single-strand DNA-binding protein